MSAAAILTLADAVVAELNAAEFVLPVAAQRGYLPTFELPEMNRLQVTVVPRQDDGRLDTRESTAHDYQLDIGVQQKPEKPDNAHLDPLVLLTQQIADHFRFGRVASTSLVSPKIRILYLQEHLQKFNQFTAVVTLTFKGSR